MSILLRASDVYSYHRPSKCWLRVWLRRHGSPETGPSRFELVLRELGERHEAAHLAGFPEPLDLSGVPPTERKTTTLEAIRRHVPVIYQGAFGADVSLGGVSCHVAGYPDYLIRRDAGYVIRDSKLARRVGERPPARPGRRPPEPHHPEILLQLRIYGWLYEQAVGEPPAALEVHAGTGEIVEIPHDGAEQALAVLERIATLELDPVEPYEPVGWSKCAGCGFHDRCWPAATARRDVALLQSVNQERARALRGAGVVGVEDLLARFDEAGLAALSWVGKPPGAKPRVLGAKAASRLLREARVLADGRDEVLEPLAIPTSSSYAVFDVEGLPAYLDDLEKVYLWGLRVFGASAGPYLAATAGFGEEGDRQGWEAFLAHARSVFERQGDVPFVHWGDYERTRLRLYVQRFGDPGGIAERVLANHHDLCRAAKRSIVLPLPSYGLKVIEQHVGFRRTIPDYSGEEAMADYIEAVETEDETGRERLMGRILAYNEEDLEATWAVLTWLRDRTAGGDAAGPLAAPATPPVDSA